MDFSYLGDRIRVCVAAVLLFLWVDLSFCIVYVERRASGNDAESHETLAQRIEKDVVGFTRTPAFTTEASSRLLCPTSNSSPALSPVCAPQQILNCALDDIEIFVSRLQKAAEAFTQLNSRNKSKKNKKKGPAGLCPFLLLPCHQCAGNMGIYCSR